MNLLLFWTWNIPFLPSADDYSFAQNTQKLIKNTQKVKKEESFWIVQNKTKYTGPYLFFQHLDSATHSQIQIDSPYNEQ